MTLDDAIAWVEWLPSGERRARGSVGDLLRAIVERQPRRRLPPAAVLADIVGRGRLGGGQQGGLRWRPFDVAPLYAALAERVDISRHAAACGATRVEEWRAWCDEADAGIAYDPHLRVLDALRAAELARERGDDADGSRYAQAIGDYFTFLNDAGAWRSR